MSINGDMVFKIFYYFTLMWSEAKPKMPAGPQKSGDFD